MDIFKNRRSIRKYNNTEIEDELIRKIILSGMEAPTACNMQGYKFIIINDLNILQKIIKKGSATFLQNVKTSILVLYEKNTNNIEYKDNIISGSLVIENMLLQASILNIGSCLVCNLPKKRVLKKILSIPKCYEIIGLVTLGYYDYKPEYINRKYSIEEVLSYNKFVGEINKNNKNKLLYKIYRIIPKTKLVKALAFKYEKKFNN